MKKKHLINIVLVALFVLFIVPRSFQNDTFYSVPIGNEILNNGIFHIDKFSQHDGLLYETPHWLFDVLVAIFHRINGLDGIYAMCIIFTITFGVAFYLILNKNNKNEIVSLVMTLITLFLLRGNFVARAQLISYTLFILEYYFINQLIETKKIRYSMLLVVIAILIANIHLAMVPMFLAFFLPYIAEHFLIQLSVPKMMEKSMKRAEKRIEKIKATTNEKKLIEIEEKKIKYADNYFKNRKKTESYKVVSKDRNDINIIYITLAICFISFVINPFNILPYTYTIKSMIGLSTKMIVEHMPPTIIYSMGFIVTSIIIITVLMFTKMKIKMADAFYLLGLAMYAVCAYKGIPLYIFMGMMIITPLITDYLRLYSEPIDKINEKIYSSGFYILTLFILIGIISDINYSEVKNTEFIPKETYPVEAVSYIKEKLEMEELKIFNEYDYGSYLMYNDIKPFIDSRADLYCKEFNQDCKVIQDYYDVYSGKINFKELQDKYSFTHFLVPNRENLSKYYLENNEYELIYEDENFLLYEYDNIR